jgi:hypothetical protein
MMQLKSLDRKMQLTNHFHLASTLLALLWLGAGCGRKAETPVSQPAATNQSVATPAQPAAPSAPAASPSAPSTETATELQSTLAAAQAAARSQNYSNPVQRFDALRSSGKLTGDQLGKIQDAEARLMRELAAKAAAGDQTALRQFRELADRSRSGR